MASCRCRGKTESAVLAAGLALGIVTGPVLELIGVEFAIEVGYALGEASLGVRDGPVVDDGADLFEKEVEEQSSGEIADRDVDRIQILFLSSSRVTIGESPN